MKEERTTDVQVSRTEIDELNIFLRIEVDRAIELHSHVSSYGSSKLKNLRREVTWAVYGLENVCKKEEDDNYKLDEIEKYLSNYFSDPQKESVPLLIKLIIKSLSEYRLPTEDELCKCYGIPYDLDW
ncbi:MAG: hypothetical protein KAH31_05220 [Candidatus Sabulitectum sp.]|nr:hypothetical protein [Candidatus Sabulitectum sp.]